MIAGRYRGHRLAMPRGSAVRPSSQRVREAVFSMLGPINGLRALDLFAGSGLLGIEALSRGAAECVFCDRDQRAVSCIRANLKRLGVQACVFKTDARRYLDRELERGGTPFDLVFVDPPYNLVPVLAGPVCEKLPALVTNTARIVFESAKRSHFTPTLPVVSKRTYGDTEITICSVD